MATPETNKQKIAQMEDLMSRASPLIDRVDHLMQLYVRGVDKLPPREVRQQLEQIMQTLDGMKKPTSTIRFQYGSLRARFITFRERWEKLLREKERV